MPTRVKICGVTCREDAEIAIAAGAHALGFNGWPGSKRYIDLEEAGAWIATLPAFVSRVAVLVNPERSIARRILSLPWIDAVQLHGSESPDFCRELAQGGMVIKAIPAAEGTLEADPDAFGVSNVLLDAWKPGEFGGTGREIDLNFAREFCSKSKHLAVTIAGGLTPDNVGKVVSLLHPYAVDVASGVESVETPRRKDPVRLLEFIRAVEAAR